jgi:hypothetical protein
MKNALRYLGFTLIMAGLICIPFPVINPEAAARVFPWLATSGLLGRFGAGAMAIGAALFGGRLPFEVPTIDACISNVLGET